MVKDTAKNEWKGAMGSQLKDSTAKDVALSMTVLISRTLLFELNVTLMSVFNLPVLLSYRAIRGFLVQKI